MYLSTTYPLYHTLTRMFAQGYTINMHYVRHSFNLPVNLYSELRVRKRGQTTSDLISLQKDNICDTLYTYYTDSY